MKQKDIFTTIILCLIVVYLGYFTKIETANRLETLVEVSTQSIVFVETEIEKKITPTNRFLGPPPSTSKSYITGTGFFISSEYIVTNAHVVSGGVKFNVYISASKDPIEAKLVGKDIMTDLAILKIDTSKIDLKLIIPIKWGNSHEIRIGQPVYAIGHPHGLNFTVTRGIISYNGRYVNNPYQEVVQTDAAVNSGNSGGPLFNMDGDVIGINSFIFNKNGSGSIGLNFAVSQFTAEFIVNRLLEEGKIERTWIGIALSTQISDKVIIIRNIVPDGPASKSELHVNDEILFIDGHRVKNLQDFFIYLEHSVRPGQQIILKIRRYADVDVEPTVFYIKIVTGLKPEIEKQPRGPQRYPAKPPGEE